MPLKRFPIRLGRWSRPFLLLFGATPANSCVDLDGDLHAHFGFFGISTPIENIARWRIEGPWLWITAIGLRRGILSGEISFDGNHRGGVRLDFKERAHFGPLRPPALYVTVADLEGFAAALAASGIPGEDARRAQGG